MAKKSTPDGANKPIRKPRKRVAVKRSASRSSRSKRKKKNVFSEWYANKPRWVVWLASGIIVAAYAVALYFFFIRPYLYRWNTEEIYFYRQAVHGIDISHHQGEIDWVKLGDDKYKGNVLHFVIMKATEGSDMLDTTFQRNFANARESGFIRGAYHFFSPLSPASRQADFYIRNVRLEAHDLPPVLDVERRGSYGDDSLRIEVKNWLRILEAHYGVKPIIYASYRFKENYLSDSLLNTYPFWIAHYEVDTLEYKGKWAFWQYRDNGELEGIKGKVDMNVFNGDLQELLKLTIQEKEASPVHQPMKLAP